MHVVMMYQFLHLATQGIMYGTFLNGMNEKEKDCIHEGPLSYLHHLAEYLKKI
jgi:hypothetical protein